MKTNLEDGKKSLEDKAKVGRLLLLQHADLSRTTILLLHLEDEAGSCSLLVGATIATLPEVENVRTGIRCAVSVKHDVAEDEGVRSRRRRYD